MVKFRSNNFWFFLFMIIFFLSAILLRNALAGDYHQDDQPHRVTYMIIDSNGETVSGETVNISVERSRDGSFLDFSDGTFKSSGWTTRSTTMTYDSTGEHYWREITVDSATLMSGDYCAIISNDSATYEDHDMECWNVDRLENLVKINR